MIDCLANLCLLVSDSTTATIISSLYSGSSFPSLAEITVAAGEGATRHSTGTDAGGPANYCL